MARILIIEDDLRLSRMYEKILSFEGNQIDIAYDGEEGLKKANEGKPDLILLDIMMPKMGGIEVLEKLKADQSTKNTPVVMLTSLSDEGQLEEALAKGAAKYIRKGDTDPQQVSEMIRELVGGRNEVQESEVSTA